MLLSFFQEQMHGQKLPLQTDPCNSAKKCLIYDY